MLEIAIDIVLVAGYGLWLHQLRRHSKTKVLLKAARILAETRPSSFANRQAKQIIRVQKKIKTLVQSLERLDVPNEKKRDTVLALVYNKLPGIGIQVTDAAINISLKEIRE